MSISVAKSGDNKCLMVGREFEFGQLQLKSLGSDITVGRTEMRETLWEIATGPPHLGPT